LGDVIPAGLTLPEANAILALSPYLASGHVIAWFCDPDDGLVAHVLREGVGTIAAVVRMGEHIALLDFKRSLGGVSGRYDAIRDVVNVLRLSLAEAGPGPLH
jgi:hypothetical protein